MSERLPDHVIASLSVKLAADVERLVKETLLVVPDPEQALLVMRPILHLALENMEPLLDASLDAMAKRNPDLPWRLPRKRTLQ